MNALIINILALIIGSACFAVIPKADFFVAPNGSDGGKGTLSSPFATLARARDAVRELKQTKKTAITVMIRGGTYFLDQTVVFGLIDSGKDGATVTYSNYPGEKPVFSGARPIKKWQKAPADLLSLPEQAKGKVWVANVSGDFKVLFDDAGILPRARSEGFRSISGSKKNLLRFPIGSLKNWSNLKDIEIFIRPHHAWITNMLPLLSVNEKAGIAITSLEATYAMNPLHFLKNEENFWVENAIDELDEPGEWALNTQDGKLYLWPRNETTILAPQLLELIRVEGKIDFDGACDAPVRNLVFRGLTFMHGERYSLTNSDAGLQHDWDMLDKANALIRFRGTENCAILDCHFAHSGSGAIRVDLHGINNKISGNHIEQMGGGGILLCGYGPGTKDVNRQNLVYNNNIHHVGRIYWHSPGIFLWQSGENRVANNLIHHTPYSAIIISGYMTHFLQKRNARELFRTVRWHELDGLPSKITDKASLPFKHSHDNRIEYNEIHHAMELLGDGNGIYIRGAGTGNVIRQKYIHHLVAPTRMQSAIRTDGGQRDTLIAENLIYKCASQGIKLKLNNRVENNIIADIINSRGYLVMREGPMTGATIKRNIFYHSSGGECSFIQEDTKGSRGRKLALIKDAYVDYNIYYIKGDTKLASEELDKNQELGGDFHSLLVDPLFIDPANGDFRFRRGSPALEFGIRPINISHIGLKNK